MGLINDTIERHRLNILDKELVWRENYNLTVTAIEEVDGSFGKQWKLSVINVSKDNEEGFVFFSQNSPKRNGILTDLKKHLDSTKQPIEGLAFRGKVLREKTKFEPAKIAISFREWAESYD